MITDIALEHNDTELTLVSQIIELLRLLDTLSDPEKIPIKQKTCILTFRKRLKSTEKRQTAKR